MIIAPSPASARELDRKFAALADPTRRAILARLAEGEATVSELQKPFRISQPAISRHLKVLEAAGLIQTGHAAQSRPRRLNLEALAQAAEWFDQIRALWSDSFDQLEALLQMDPNLDKKGS
jgi:DNA-binding transcriptional ArsR family regulator